MAYSRLLAYDAVEAGVLAADEVADAKSVLPDSVFKELYLAEPSDDGGNPFGIKSIGECVKPLSTLPPAWWGWDLAKSTDWCVGIALAKNGGVCRLERFQKPWLHTIAYIKKVTGSVPALVDSTGVGDPILEALQGGGGSNFVGFKSAHPASSN